MNRNILCIDLKSFYASCECLLLNKDPFTTPLVVASKTQGKGAITLAITPYLKSLGIKSRSRLYEIPKNIKYTIIEPKMNYYIKKSKEVLSVYLDFISIEDIHVYSIDEAFLDVTTYLNFYKCNDITLAKKILKEIYNKTGLHATCGISHNMFLAKVALDIESKSNKDSIAKWTYKDIKNKLWKVNDLTSIWGIGNKINKKLNNLNIYSVYDLAHYDKNKLKDIFGIIGTQLHNHANGFDDSIISNNKINTKHNNISSSQILHKDYNIQNIKLIIKETINTLAKRLRNSNKQCKSISLTLISCKSFNISINKSITMDTYTNNEQTIYNYTIILLNNYYKDIPIRKISISLSNILISNKIQLSLFENNTKLNNLNKTLDNIQEKYGTNSITRTTSLLKESTIIDRNNKIGGHNK